MTNRQRDGRGRFRRGVATAERDARALELASRSMSYRQIAAELGCDVHTAYTAVQRGLAAIPAPAAAEYRRIELDKLDRLERHLLGVMEREHVSASHGRVVTLDGKPVLDDGPGVQAAVALLRVQDRRARLLGLDAPTLTRVQVEDVVDAEIRRLEAELAAGVGAAGEAAAPS